RARRGRAFRSGLSAQRGAGPDDDLAPVAIECRNQFAIGGLRPVAARPGRALGILPGVARRILEAAEIARPGRVDALWIGLEAGVEILDVAGVAAVEEGGEQELFVLFLSGHV